MAQSVHGYLVVYKYFCPLRVYCTLETYTVLLGHKIYPWDLNCTLGKYYVLLGISLFMIFKIMLNIQLVAKMRIGTTASKVFCVSINFGKKFEFLTFHAVSIYLEYNERNIYWNVGINIYIDYI